MKQKIITALIITVVTIAAVIAVLAATMFYSGAL